MEGPLSSELENGLLHKQLDVFTVTLSPDSPEQHRDEVGSMGQSALQCSGNTAHSPEGSGEAW